MSNTIPTRYTLFQYILHEDKHEVPQADQLLSDSSGPTVCLLKNPSAPTSNFIQQFHEPDHQAQDHRGTEVGQEELGAQGVQEVPPFVGV